MIKTLRLAGLFILTAIISVSCKHDDDTEPVVTPVDKTIPVITLKGDYKMKIQRNEHFDDPGATATDDVDGDISSRIVVTSYIDSSKLGLYSVIYTVEDKAGNDAVPQVRNVEVIIGREDYLGAYNVEMDENCSAAYQLNSPQQVKAGSGPDDIILSNFFPLIGGDVPAKINGTKISIIPTTLQSFLNISGSGEMDESGKFFILNFTFENTLPIVGGVESCQATYTRL